MAELQAVNPSQAQVWEGLNVSYGIAPILNQLSEISKIRNKPIWTLFLINVETLVRNRKTYKKDERPPDFRTTAKEVLDDCIVLAQYLAAYARLTIPPQLKQKALICFYLPDYSKIPVKYLKDKLPAHTEWRWSVLKAIKEQLKKMKEQGWNIAYEEADVVFCAPSTDKTVWPHKGLVQDLSHAYSDVGYRKTLMISHVPSDFMLYKTFKDFTILESYTGKLKTIKDFGEKVFKDPNLPFNKYTLLLLGDNCYLQNQLDRKQKHTLKEVAAAKHWGLLPDKQVLEEIKNLNMVPIELLIKPDI